MLWTSIFPFSFAFPLVLPLLLLSLAPGIYVFFFFPVHLGLILDTAVLKEIQQCLSSVFISLYYPILTRVSLCFLFLFFLFSFCSLFCCSPSAPLLYSSPLYSFSFAPCSFFPWFFQFCVLCNFVFVIWDFFGFSQYSPFASIILCLSASSLISFDFFFSPSSASHFFCFYKAKEGFVVVTAGLIIVVRHAP